MAQKCFDGVLYGAHEAGKSPVVILTPFEERAYEDWVKENAVSSEIFWQKDPKSGIDRIAVSISQGAAQGIANGTPVTVCVDTQKWHRGGKPFIALDIVSVSPRQA
jgi:hypothetical protein